MQVLAVILARAGSKGLPGKCVRPLLGRAVIEYSFDHALAARRVDAVVLSTDSEPAKRMARARGITVVDRPAELAGDSATVDDAARHAVAEYEQRAGQTADVVALLYGNIPVRAEGLIDRAVQHLIDTGADSVRSVAPATKQHPDWVHRLDGDRMIQFRTNSIYRRQDLEPLFYHDGAVAVVTRAALFAAPRWEGDFQGFLGGDRRAIVQEPHDSVDIDGMVDFHLAEAILRTGPSPSRDLQVARTSAQAEACGSARPASVSIGAATIREGGRIYVIAEAGVNHNGSVDQALELVDAATRAGAGAVKFQMFNADALVTADAAAAEYQTATAGRQTQREMLRGLELSRDDFAAIRQRCRQCGVEFLATPFSPGDLEALVQLEVTAIKLASTDLNNVPLVRAAVETSLPLVVSTGAATGQEIAKAVGLLEELGARGRTVLMHCVSSYPTRWEDANLLAISRLQRQFGMQAGFSDHTLSETTGGLAAAAGARVIEKHFTLDRAAAGPDQAMSLEPDALAAYIRGIREAEQALGDGRLDATAAEQEVRHLARRSVVAARDIRAGQVLTPKTLTTKRPAGGLEPAEIDRLVGKRAVTDIAADARITWEMVR